MPRSGHTRIRKVGETGRRASRVRFGVLGPAALAVTSVFAVLAPAVRAQDAPAAAPAQPAVAAAAPETPAAPSTVEEIHAAALAKWKTIREYTCILNTWTKRGEATSHKIIEFAFKRPDLVRNYIVDGDNKGTTVVRDAKGRLRGKKGGVLSLVKLTLEEDDERLFNLRGVRFDQGHFGYVLEGFGKEMADGWTVELAPDAAHEGADCRVLVARPPEGAKTDLTRDEIWIEKSTLLLRRRRQYVGETKVSDTSYTKVVLDPGLADDLFDL